jgi:hypothetical protein
MFSPILGIQNRHPGTSSVGRPLAAPRAMAIRGEIEKELFVRLALCIDPRKAAAAGLSKRALRSFGIGAAGLSDKERRYRAELKNRVVAEMKPYKASPHVLPGLGPHADFPAEAQIQLEIPARQLQSVAKKIVRGCEFWLAGGRVVEPPYEIEIIFAHAADIQDSLRAFAPFGSVYLGPGFRVRRAGANDDPNEAMYEIVLWNTLTFYASILPAEPVQVA